MSLRSSFLHGRSALVCGAALLLACCASAQNYPLTPDSMEQTGVPKGAVYQYKFESRKVFPGTVRDYWVYVPYQYDPRKEACLMVFQDGGGYQSRTGGFRVPVVFDNLIQKGEMPVTIAIMVNPGVVPAPKPDALPRYNRTYEYDALTDDYSRFLIEELIPEVQKSYTITSGDWAIGGASSGGICAFTAAWERPDKFSRVLSFIGSFTNLRGGHIYPSLIRKSEPRPVKVFLQENAGDQDIYSGSWPIGNSDVYAALKFARYDAKYEVGEGGHDGRHGTAIFPEALKWLWAGYPKPIKTPIYTPQPVIEVLDPFVGWESLWNRHNLIPSVIPSEAGGIASDTEGTIYVAYTAVGLIEKWTAGREQSTFARNVGDWSALACAGGERLWAVDSKKDRLWVFNSKGKPEARMRGRGAVSVVGRPDGSALVLCSKSRLVWSVTPKGEWKKMGEVAAGATGITLTPDQSLLIVSQADPGVTAFSYQIAPDRTLAHEQAYFDVYTRYGAASSGAQGMVTDTDGRLYLASAAGIQVFDQAGRVIGIIRGPGETHLQTVEGASLPKGGEVLPVGLDGSRGPKRPNSSVQALAFGIASRNVLFVVADGRLYRRLMRVKGVCPAEAPIRPKEPRL